MSFTLFPLAGVERRYHYLPANEVSDWDVAQINNVVQNGVFRYWYDWPELNFSNSRATFVAHALGLQPPRPSDGFVGTVPAKDIAGCLNALDSFMSTIDPTHEYTWVRSHELREFLLHCQFHACGFNYG